MGLGDGRRTVRFVRHGGKTIEAQGKPNIGTAAVISAAAVVVLIYGMQAAQRILVPFLVAVFLAVICTPLLHGMRRLRIPAGIAVFVIVAGIIGILALAGAFVGGSIAEFTARLPFYEQQLDIKLADLAGRFDTQFSVSELLDQIQPASPMGLVANLFTGLQSLFANFFLIIFTVIFLLLEASTMPRKLQLVLAGSHADPDYFKRFTHSVQRYLGIKTLISLVTGILAWTLTSIIGLDFPLLWGLLAFLFNYVPTIGSLIASIPPIVLALVQFGLAQAAIIGVGYLALNVTIGGLIEPRVMGRGLGLSTLVVFLSLVFWGWVFGPIGMLLSVPLTMTAKIALESGERTAPLAILMGSGEEPVLPRSAGASGDPRRHHS
ncbi:MAG: AI-2E family transporter [Gammaproteobacteria bacterium]|nr:AI-2E family transporter [Gammaproteobacteria bacterium]MDH3508157.1 AI-2E family transporter [Gammaproteobacteria bacterium]